MKMKTLRKWCWLFFLLGMILPLSAEEYVVKGGQGEPMLAKEETALKLKVLRSVIHPLRLNINGIGIKQNGWRQNLYPANSRDQLLQ